ncbi:MAG: DUF3370 domain-containing protein [Cyanobacteria bacterium]|nr:DUF3370 domain-containing protein [Cyanobacteriota bacterium]
MLTAFSWLSLAQVALVSPALPVEVAAAPLYIANGQQYAEVVRQQEIRPLPGQLDSVPVFNSNSPELVQEEGILLSTFPGEGMTDPDAHLNYAFEGRFDIFTHHIARGLTHSDRRTLFMGTVVYNPTDEPVQLEILQGVSYLSQQAPFRDLPSYVANPNGLVFAGPGSRVGTDVLLGRHQDQWPATVEIPPKQAYLLMNAPIPLRQLPFSVDATLPPGIVLPLASAQGNDGIFAADRADEIFLASADTQRANLPAVDRDRPLPSNGRTAMLYLHSSGPVYVANLAMFAPRNSQGQERAPTLREWLNLLVNDGVAGPRDIAPTDPSTYSGGNARFFYGRVAGVARGSKWSAFVTDGNGTTSLRIPDLGEAFSYVISTVDRNTLGTGQIQSADMLVRYPDTAYRSHGNYGVHYNVALPLHNPTNEAQTVAIKLQTPLQDESLTAGLRFRNPPEDRIFYRGTVRVSYSSGILGNMQSRYIHVVQRRGQEGEPLLQLRIPAGVQRLVEVDLIYPADATPPQVLTVKTLGDDELEVIEANAQTQTN